ncbi:DUF2510 domain-containing protein [Demequina subtropica]|uniref:DUF2510 domain-containing protein n=1 Tax=Demequina subtropica TaxID=1638989 RepID=UPI000782869E|nr:DUF2510 domain-containing protein [Demequina subtropica]
MTTESNVDAPAAGWYPDPSDATRQRWWDGAAWTEQTAPAGAEPFAAAGTDPFAQPEPVRRNPWKIVGSAVAALVVGYLVYSGVVAAIEGATGDDDAPAVGAEGARAIPAADTGGWSSVAVMGGAGGIMVDPEWTDIADVLGADAMSEQMSELAGGDIAVDGAWLTAGDLMYGGTMLMVMSVTDTSDASTPQIEVESFVESATAGAEYTMTNGEDVVTAEGFPGYIAEFDIEVDGLVLSNSVGVIADGRHQLMVYATGTEELGSGTERLEAVLDSFTAQ